MLFETLKQSYIFLGSLYFGLVCGIIKNFTDLIIKSFKNNKIITFILDITFMLIFGLLFVLCS